MSPILVRPVREQLEHDRLIRYLLLNKYKRRFEANGNAGDERGASVKIGTVTLFPDIVLIDGKKIAGIVEVETGESVNNLEAMAEWVHFAKARAPFYLYVPVASLDAARRLCEVHQLHPAEIWSYRGAMDGFDLVRVLHNPSAMGTTKVELVTLPVVKPAVPPPAGAPAEAKPAPPEAKVEAGKTAKPVKPALPVSKVAAPPPPKPPAKAPAKPVKPVKVKPAKPVAKPKAAKPKPKSKPTVKGKKKKR